MNTIEGLERLFQYHQDDKKSRAAAEQAKEAAKLAWDNKVAAAAAEMVGPGASTNAAVWEAARAKAAIVMANRDAELDASRAATAMGAMEEGGKESDLGAATAVGAMEKGGKKSDLGGGKSRKHKSRKHKSRKHKSRKHKSRRH